MSDAMTASRVTQVEANRLLKVPKCKVDSREWIYPGLGGQIRIPLTSTDKREKFWLDVTRGKMDMTKGSYQNRARKTIVLARLDFGARPHRNPDGQPVGSPHLHLYREGHGDKWAFEVPSDRFSTNAAEPWIMLEDFLGFCNVVDRPIIARSLEPA